MTAERKQQVERAAAAAGKRVADAITAGRAVAKSVPTGRMAYALKMEHFQMGAAGERKDAIQMAHCAGAICELLERMAEAAVRSRARAIDEAAGR